ncbi:MAG: TonB-dependent receptor [Chitinophagales bacterium]|nr:TonB-dependent receptor [Chitinophagales bacterium]MDW8418581.1 TonB-dependent receptor [Chitinophagales bacterium]
MNRVKVLIRGLLCLYGVTIIWDAIAQGTVKPTRFTISGYVKEAANGEAMMGAAVYAVEPGKGATTNEYGFYSLTLPEGEYTLRISYIGFTTIEKKVSLREDIRLNFDMSNAAAQIQEVVVTGERKGQNVESTDMGKQQLSVEVSKSLPALLGEVDVLKTLQLLPGIANAGEGNSAMYVRGGGPDQNLVLLDDAVVYNTGHLFGFFSVFNSDAVKNTTVIKGGMPANYGGRISSVVDVQMKEGNMKRWSATGGIGLISSRLTVEGPIKKERASFIVSARRTYIDVLLRPILPKIGDGEFAGNEYFFYDINAKVNYRISDKDRLYLSGYFGRDVFNFRDPGGNFKLNFPWGNATATFRWNHLFSDKLFMNTMLIYNDFGFKANTSFQDVTFSLNSSVREATAKIDFDYSPIAGHMLQFGGQYNFHIFTPYQATGNAGETTFRTTNQERKYAHESSVYFLDDFDATSWLKINTGLRASLFNFVGPFSKIIFSNGIAIDTLRYRPGENIATYWGIEPRFSSRIKIDNQSSIKVGITYNQQYIHLVSSSTTTLPVDLWVPSTKTVKPQLGLQGAVGYFRNFKDDMIETSVEVYYKHLWNQIEYGESAVGNITVDVEDLFTFGRGWTYGAEFFVKKAKGKWTGWVGYTLAWSWRKFPEINEGEKFLARFDRRHDLSIVQMYEFNRHWKVSATFVYATGQRTTLPVSFFLNEGEPQFVYGKRNWFRMPPYHRLDFGFVYTIIPKRKLKINFTSDITFSLYNAYNRMNPYFIYIINEGTIGGNPNDDENGAFRFKAKQASLFPILPSVTWNFKF